MEGSDPSVHQILHAIRPKAPFTYPVWMPTFFLFAMIADGQGECEFQVELRLVRLNEDQREVESLIGASKSERVDLGRHPLRVRPLSIMMPPVLLPERGVYRLYLVSERREIGAETFHAR